MSDAKLKQFEEILIAERDKLKRSFTVTTTVYVVVALAITVYAIIVFNGFRTLIGPKGLSEQVMTYINMAAGAPQDLRNAYHENKNDLAELVVKRALDSIPEVEGVIKTKLDDYNDDIKEAIRREVMPNFKDYMKGSMPELKARLAELKKTRPDATVGMALTSAFVEYLEKESARLLNEDKVIEEAGKLQRDLYALDKLKGPMTRKELATRKLLISFILIAKMDTTGSPLVEEFHRFLQERFGVTPRQIQEDKVLDDVTTDDKQEEL